ncbi:DedA family protein [Actinophytocola algeriensis]|uniref:Membrane protein DedA with SNARE-associated domain n=1 Tax=Actinophytocola algeriensis TaxID=1768010 RepID=A0A7W7QAW9_9PSEU|nr:DedA family protein [Actinophytocola algeriensis]MBB4909791.1 membrane protein DedA with SNARE-associated domain [Actinophytocola algeriensis]MBE1475781.1 membrane protein DedA with SNARE-associated domain [Actinophytocola algeriensis]
MIADFLDWLAALPPAGVVAVAGLLVFGETTLGLGFVAPGETGLFVLGTTAVSPPRFVVMWLVTSVCAVGGDAVGYWLGRRYGPRLRQTAVVRRHGAKAWDRASDVLRRRGAWAVLVAIFLPVLRTLVPAAAGASGLPFRRFLPAVAVGATAWCALHIGIGAAAGEAARQVEDWVGRGSWALAAVLVAGVAVVLLVRRRRGGGLRPPVAGVREGAESSGD